MGTEQKGCLSAILSLFGIKTRSQQSQSDTEELPYRLRDDFLSPAEASFYRVLKVAIGDQLLIFPKVGLQELFFVPRQEGDRAFRNKIDRKHVDFVLCHPATLNPCAAIELDDASHKRPDRIERDEFVDKVFATASLPLIRVTAQANYSTQQLRDLLKPFSPATQPSEKIVAQAAEPGERLEVEENASAQVPLCPKCGIPLLLRTVRKGAHVGKQFYGCTNYPQCREMLPLSST
jgi:hypothetical protein